MNATHDNIKNMYEDDELPLHEAAMQALSNVASKIITILTTPPNFNPGGDQQKKNNSEDENSAENTVTDISTEDFRAIVKELRERNIVTQMAAKELIDEKIVHKIVDDRKNIIKKSVVKEVVKEENNLPPSLNLIRKKSNPDVNTQGSLDESQFDTFLIKTQKQVALASKDALVRHDSSEQIQALRRVSVFEWANMSQKWKNIGKLNLTNSDDQSNRVGEEDDENAEFNFRLSLNNPQAMLACPENETIPEAEKVIPPPQRCFLLKFDDQDEDDASFQGLPSSSNEEGTDVNQFSRSLIVSFGGEIDLKDFSSVDIHSFASISNITSFQIDSKNPSLMVKNDMMEGSRRRSSLLVNVIQLQEKTTN